MIYRYEPGALYEAGDGVLYAGAIWTATVDTQSVPGSGSDWQMCGRVAAWPHYKPKMRVVSKESGR